MEKKIPIKTLYLIAVISIGLVGLGIGSTFAMFTASASINNPISLSTNLNYGDEMMETVEVSIPAGEFKIITLNLSNSSGNNLKYTTWYISDDIIQVGKYRDTSPDTVGTINSGSSISIKLRAINYSRSETNFIIGVSSSLSSVVLGNDMHIVSNNQLSPSASEMIRNLFNKNNSVISNSVSLEEDTTHSMIKDHDGNIRYYGENPNNYVYFNCSDYSNQNSTNCELWRIIGVFGNNLKLMRKTSIGNYSWDTSPLDWDSFDLGAGISDWPNADLMKLLNPGYESNRDLNSSGATVTVNNSLYYKAQSGTCYGDGPGEISLPYDQTLIGGFGNETLACDFTNTGIKNDSTRNLISTYDWNLGSWDLNRMYPNEVYNRERSNLTYSGRAFTWSGKIALPYPSDYAYATDLSKCDSVLYLYNDSSDNYACRRNNWMWYTLTPGNNNIENEIEEQGAVVTTIPNASWLLTPFYSAEYGQNNMAAYVSPNGTAYDDGGVAYTFRVHPTFYLNDVAFILNGDGSESNPYMLDYDW